MILKQAKSLRWIFLRSQILVSVVVMSLVTAALTILLLALANYIDERRVVELARSIESQALIAKSPRHLQLAITQIVNSRQARGIAIFTKGGQVVVAANSTLSKDNQKGWLVADAKVRQQVSMALAKGVFGLHTISSANRRVTIFPLAPAISAGKNRPGADSNWATPAWHKSITIPQLSSTTLWQRIPRIFNLDHSHDFTLPADQYAGAVVIETSRNWITSLLLQSILVIAVLMAASILIVLLFLSGVLKKNVLLPVNRYTKVIQARRAGNEKARVPVSNIIEFDELAWQWNSLLDFRQVAQGQNMVLSTLLEHVPVGIDVTDTDGNIEYANPSFQQMTGYLLAEVIGKSPEKFLASKRVDHTVLGDSLVAFTKGESWTGEVTYRRKNGTDLVCNTTFVPIFGRDDKFERMISLRHDISDLKEDERALIAARVKAETADKAKSEFLTNMSHELRTPLNAIIGFSEMMALETLGPIDNREYVEFSRLIETSSRTLLSTINLILDMSRLDAHRLQLNQTDFCVSEMLDKLIESKIAGANAFGITIKRDLTCKNDICTDQRMLHKILGFLICNAVRYNSEGGEVLVCVRDKRDKVIVSIKDNGIGISAEDLPKVTEPFFRVDGALARASDGAGLGLTLTKKFTREQNIGFEITSTLGEGTTVTLTFPISRVQSLPTEENPQALSA